MDELLDTTAGMTIKSSSSSEDDEEEVQEFSPVARETSTPNIERIMNELSLLNHEDKKEVFFGLQKLLADDGYYTLIRQELPANVCKDCGMWLRGDFRKSGLRLCRKCLPAHCTNDGCTTRLIREWRWVGKCREHGGYEGFPKQ